MNPTVEAVANKTDSKLIIKDKTKKKPESVSPHSIKKLTNENLLDMTFISKTNKPVYIRVQSVVDDGGNGEERVEVEVGEAEEEEEDL
ncbi:hypothetical protein [Rhodohalobacter sulfatireducens]|uniref:Uncharacterized protein n=1 Tax=Rhodohalobacter sulfatireducens TaxID=2911366 RepID=A0ABS9KAV5_9BACT|nr:hypothetical protein [Rhodohalobacter sulfatireducens]MCG2587981.1 hypothetical protein [Rhodohalobacter sulfatireducens]